MDGLELLPPAPPPPRAPKPVKVAAAPRNMPAEYVARMEHNNGIRRDMQVGGAAGWPIQF